MAEEEWVETNPGELPRNKQNQLCTGEYNGRAVPSELSLSRYPAEELSLPSLSVALVKNHSNRSAHLPIPCDVCENMISEYPFIAKHSNSGRHRMYHVACALRIGLVLSAPTPITEEILLA